jgi:hypothetical protein
MVITPEQRRRLKINRDRNGKILSLENLHPAFHLEKLLSRVVVMTDKQGEEGALLLLKAASRSLVADPKTRRRVVGEHEIPKVVHVFVRDPMDRLKSAYQFFRKAPPIQKSARIRRKKITWEEFVDAVLDGVENPHWRPASYGVDKVEAEGSTVVPHLFENIGREYPFGELPYKNESREKVKVDLTYRLDEVKAFYADDYNLRRDANNRQRRL